MARQQTRRPAEQQPTQDPVSSPTSGGDLDVSQIASIMTGGCEGYLVRHSDGVRECPEQRVGRCRGLEAHHAGSPTCAELAGTAGITSTVLDAVLSHRCTACR